ncbi:MAG: hypothetical protein K1X49_01870 [Saprospiraceae bacterium]|nr:hypothetical protein [Saprospiraceae bacterium]
MRVLICPQHWGLGHLTRSIPVIRYFINSGHEVLLASSGAGVDFLRSEFPEIEVFELPDYKINYPSSNMYLNMLTQLGKMHLSIWKEHIKIRELVRLLKIELLISDTRFGAFHGKIPSVMIAHHLHIPLSIKSFSWFSDTWLKLFYNKFDRLWVPDRAGSDNISGILAHNFKSAKKIFLGNISRFQKLELSKRYDICFVLSGPEPQRTILEEKILDYRPKLSHLKCLLIRGKKEIHHIISDESFQIVDILYSPELNEAMCASDMIVSRSGYTTLLDLSIICKKAFLIPTPGQFEQEYLAQDLKDRGIYYTIDQKNIDFDRDLEAANDGYTGFLPRNQKNESLDEILDREIEFLFPQSKS